VVKEFEERSQESESGRQEEDTMQGWRGARLRPSNPFTFHFSPFTEGFLGLLRRRLAALGTICCTGVVSR
jgi:hypothetical protein